MQEKPNYYAIIPAEVRYDKELRANEKILYGEISSLSNKEGYCYASNNYFANLYGVTVQAVSKWLSNLSKSGYLTIEYLYKTNSKEIDKRIIKLVSTNVDEGINKNLIGYQQKFKDNNTSINNTRNNNNIIIVEDNKKNGKISSENDSTSLCVKEVINYMNELAGTSYKTTTTKTRSMINARLKEGFTVEDLKDVVYFKYHEWCVKPFKFKNGVMSDTYFRPSTLFSTNFENYLQDYQNRYVEGED